MRKLIKFLSLIFCICTCSEISRGQSYDESLRRMQASFEALRNYRCTFVSFAADSDKSEEVTYGYFYKKPSSVRMEVQSGRFEGTVLLYTGTDVRLKLGYGILSWFSFAFERTDKIVCDLRGNGVHQSDWGWFIQQHIHMLPMTKSELCGVDTIDGRRALQYELHSQQPEQTHSIASEHIWIDDQRGWLLRYKQYDRAGKLIQAGYYSDIVVDGGFSDSLFTQFHH